MYFSVPLLTWQFLYWQSEYLRLFPVYILPNYSKIMPSAWIPQLFRRHIHHVPILITLKRARASSQIIKNVGKISLPSESVKKRTFLRWKYYKTFVKPLWLLSSFIHNNRSKQTFSSLNHNTDINFVHVYFYWYKYMEQHAPIYGYTFGRWY